MNREKLLAIPAASIVALFAGACSAKQAQKIEALKITCTYAAETTEVPNPAFWAITEHAGAQLIEPGSELSKVVTKKLGSVATHGEVHTGDILVATESSFLIDPELLGIDRNVISDCRPPKHRGAC